MSSDEETSKEKGTQFASAILRLSSQLNDRMIVKRSPSNVSNSGKQENQNAQSFSEFLRKKRLERQSVFAGSPQKQLDDNLLNKAENKLNESSESTQTTISRTSENTTATASSVNAESVISEENSASKLLEDVRDVLTKVELIKEVVKKLEGSSDSKQYRHLKVSLELCKHDLDNIETMGIEQVRQERRNVFKLVQVTLKELDEIADSNLDVTDGV